MTEIEITMLHTNSLIGNFFYSWKLVPGIYTDINDPHARRLLLVFGDALNRMLAVTGRLDKNGSFIPGDTVRSTRQLDKEKEWLALWPLERTDRLPHRYGPTVGDYITRMEKGEGETY